MLIWKNAFTNILMAPVKLIIFINNKLFLLFATSFVMKYHIFKRIYNKTMKY